MTQDSKYTDLSYLKEMAGDNSEIIQEMIEIFFEQIPEFKDGIRASINSTNWYDLSSITHKAKSSVRTMGMSETGEILEQIETQAKESLKLELENKKQLGLTFSSLEEKKWIHVNGSKSSIMDIDILQQRVKKFIHQIETSIEELKKFSK